MKKIYGKNILRMCAAFAAWSIFYSVSYTIINSIVKPDFEFNMSYFVAEIFSGAAHMWFIPMIIGIYMCIPIFEKICETKKIMKYYLLLSLVFVFVVPFIFESVKNFADGWVAEGFRVVNNTVSLTHLEVLSGYGFYFVLGHYINSTEFSKKTNNILLILGMIGLIIGVVLNAAVSIKQNTPTGAYHDNFNLCILSGSVFVFVLLKNIKYNNERLNDLVAKLSQCSFGAYLVHLFVIKIFTVLGFDLLVFNPLLSIPVVVFSVFAVSFIISYAISKIPVINKWIV